RQGQRVAEWEQVGRALGGHDAGHARDGKSVAFRSAFAHRAHRVWGHPDDAFGGRLAHRRDLVADIDHARGPLLIDVCQPLRHGDQDMRMPAIDGALFDYGGTLGTFAYPPDDLPRAKRGFLPPLQTALRVPAPEAAALS